MYNRLSTVVASLYRRGITPHRQPLRPIGWYSFTALMQLCLFAIAVLVPSIWKILEVSGATAGMLIAFFFPGLLILRVGPNTNKQRRVVAAHTMLVVGAMLALLTAVKPFLAKSE